VAPVGPGDTLGAVVADGFDISADRGNDSPRPDEVLFSQEFLMAQKVQVILVDDVDGGEAAETVSFALDGVTYEIDVSEVNADKLRDALAPWVGHARRVGGRSGGGRARSTGSGGGRSRSSSSASGGGGGGKHDLSDVRSWARENGYQVSDRGRVSSEVIAAYEKAH
jgi:hypothetical protein